MSTLPVTELLLQVSGLARLVLRCVQRGGHRLQRGLHGRGRALGGLLRQHEALLRLHPRPGVDPPQCQPGATDMRFQH